MTSKTRRFSTLLLESASLFALTGLVGAQAQQVAQAQMAQAEEIPENVLITGSLIHGTAAVGVPVTNLNLKDFQTTGSQTTADLFRTIPVANVSPGAVATNSPGQLQRLTRVNIRGLDASGPRSVMMVDGMRHPPQADGICSIDPSIIPSIAVDHIDILADGASAVYGSDAIAGVININLKRNFDGAITQLHFSAPDAAGVHYQASQLWGRTWDGGQVTLSYEWYDEGSVPGTAHSKYTADFSQWGLDNRSPLSASIPGTIVSGAPFAPANITNGQGTTANLGTYCQNCFAIPRGTGVAFSPGPGGIGPTAPFSASTLNWGAFNTPFNSGTNGARNVFDPLHQGTGYEVAPVQRNGGTITLDQRLTRDISFYGEAYYSNRRVEHQPSEATQPVTNDTFIIGVPTFNPYYPTGGAPTNLRVAYDIAREVVPQGYAIEVSHRYQFGLNISLPSNWTGQIYDSRSYDNNVRYENGTINKNAVSAALGWTLPATPPSGTTPGIATWTKPASVPYINLFCDVSAVACNSPTTLAYVTGFRGLNEKVWLDEKGLKFDGPLFDVPAGQVKAAVGGTYTSFNVLFDRAQNTGGTLILPRSLDSEPYNVWAGFVQVNVPVFGDNFNFPLFRKLELEGSWRHDQYHGTLVGGTSNPKFGFTWGLSEDLGATIRGSWGTSFRFANAGEYSTIASANFQDFGLPTSGSFGNINIQCTGGVAPAGSTAQALQNAGFGCNSQPPGLGYGGAPHQEVRLYTDPNTGLPASREGGLALPPEKSINYSLGAELAPQMFGLSGLDVSATWYSIKINGTLTNFNNPTTTALNDPNQRFHFITPSDLGCAGPGTPSQAAINAANANPAACVPFELMVQKVLADPNNASAPVTALTSIYWISDGGTVSTGYLKVEGVDWQASYEWDWGDLGAWNTGITGTYYLHRLQQVVAGAPPFDQYHQTLSPIGGIPQVGVETLPRMRYRARLGWSNGPWSVTGFMDYQSHYYHTQNAPPNVNNQCVTTGGTVGGGSSPCAIYGYSNVLPSWYTFDLSFGYDTGDTPANPYLRDIGIQFIIQNVMGKHPAFQYGPANTGRSIAAYDILKSDLGRIWSVTITKTW
jgi:outer membrane receptor protein involved in Fe transport